eukprot:5227156-Amphidinium_carterae.1
MPRPVESDRLTKIENQLAALMSALAVSGVVPLPTSLAPEPDAPMAPDPTQLDELSEASSVEDEGMEVSPDSMKRPAAAEQDNVPSKRLHVAEHTLRWYRLDVEDVVVQDLQWQRVRGDGNCLYRAMAILHRTGWSDFKRQ